MSDSVRPHRRQPTRLHRPWDSPGKNTGVGCHFLLQCMKEKSESEVAQSCPTLSDPMDCSLPGSSVHGIFQARVLEWGAIAFSNGITKELGKLSDWAPTHVGANFNPLQRSGSPAGTISGALPLSLSRSLVYSWKELVHRIYGKSRSLSFHNKSYYFIKDPNGPLGKQQDKMVIILLKM